jgi:hypothetical protein
MLDRSFRGNEAFNLLVNNFSDLTSKSSCFLLCSHTEMLFQGAGVAITGMAGRVCYPLLTKKSQWIHTGKCPFSYIVRFHQMDDNY